MKMPKFTIKILDVIKNNPRKAAAILAGSIGTLVLGATLYSAYNSHSNKNVQNGSAGKVTTNFTSQASSDYSTPDNLIDNLGQARVDNTQTKFTQTEKVIAGKSYTFETNAFHRPGELTHIAFPSEEKVLERDDATKTMNITSEFVYVPTRITNTFGKIEHNFFYLTNGLSPKSAKVNRPNISGVSNGVLTSDEKAVEYNLEMMSINGRDYYNPFNTPSEVNSSKKLPFVAIPKQGSRERIHQKDGLIQILSTNGGFEYIKMPRSEYNARTNQVNVSVPSNGQLAPRLPNGFLFYNQN